MEETYVVIQVEEDSGYSDVIGVFSKEKCESEFDQKGYEWYSATVNQESVLVKHREDIVHPVWSYVITYGSISPIQIDDVTSMRSSSIKKLNDTLKQHFPTHDGYVQFALDFITTIMQKYSASCYDCFFLAKKDIFEVELQRGDY